jgi:predicted MPP superfamily phosphohydrolase
MTGLKSIIGWSSFAVACLALLGYAFLVEPNWLDVNIYDVGTGNPSDRIRIVQLSDLHLQAVGKRETAIAEALQQLKPDLIILTGDVIDRPDALPILDQFLKTLGAAPKVAVLGNWEYWADIDLKALRALYEDGHGTKLLINQDVSYRIRSRSIRVVGLDDFTAGIPDLRGMAPTSKTDTNLLVMHSPGWFEQPAVAKPSSKFDLCLAGHTHGGQITLFGLPIWTPRGSGKFQSGMYETKNCPLYVSRGIGTSVLGARFGARPEVAVFDL